MNFIKKTILEPFIYRIVRLLTNFRHKFSFFSREKNTNFLPSSNTLTLFFSKNKIAMRIVFISLTLIVATVNERVSFFHKISFFKVLSKRIVFSSHFICFLFGILSSNPFSNSCVSIASKQAMASRLRDRTHNVVFGDVKHFGDGNYYLFRCNQIDLIMGKKSLFVTDPHVLNGALAMVKLREQNDAKWERTWGSQPISPRTNSDSK